LAAAIRDSMSDGEDDDCAGAASHGDDEDADGTREVGGRAGLEPGLKPWKWTCLWPALGNVCLAAMDDLVGVTLSCRLGCPDDLIEVAVAFAGGNLVGVTNNGGLDAGVLFAVPAFFTAGRPLVAIEDFLGGGGATLVAAAEFFDALFVGTGSGGRCLGSLVGGVSGSSELWSDS
jgi:hypothetical protein